jgi:hypothetical protein
VPPKRRKRQRLGDSTTPCGRLRAERPDHVWALDYQFDVTATGRTIKILHVVDEFTRESLADLVDHGIDADATVACLDKIVGTRGRHPGFIRCDNGPELTANALRDWCRFGGAGAAYIEPGSSLGEPLGRVLRQPDARRAAGHRAVRHASRSPGARRRLANRVQHLPPSLRPRHAHAGRVRGPVEADQPTHALVAGGPINGARSRGPVTWTGPDLRFRWWRG